MPRSGGPRRREEDPRHAPRPARERSLARDVRGIFAVCLIGQGLAGFRVYNHEQVENSQAVVTGLTYLRTGHFIGAVFENWESTFLQMGLCVLLTVFLFQTGSPVSKGLFESKEVDAGSKGHEDVPWPVRRGGVALRIYKNSLTLALFALFGASLALHAVGGARHASARAAEQSDRPSSSRGESSQAAINVIEGPETNTSTLSCIRLRVEVRSTRYEGSNSIPRTSDPCLRGGGRRWSRWSR